MGRLLPPPPSPESASTIDMHFFETMTCGLVGDMFLRGEQVLKNQRWIISKNHTAGDRTCLKGSDVYDHEWTCLMIRLLENFSR
jgi:hypothetical protein